MTLPSEYPSPVNSNLSTLGGVLSMKSLSDHSTTFPALSSHSTLIAYMPLSSALALLVSTVIFDDETEVIHDRVSLDKVEPITDKEYYVRGTYTKFNLDFTEDVMHLYEAGFDQISVEPVMEDPSVEYAITEEELDKIAIEKFEEDMGSPDVDGMYDMALSLTEGMPSEGVIDTLNQYWRDEYGFSSEQNAMLAELLSEENAGLWQVFD